MSVSESRCEICIGRPEVENFLEREFFLSKLLIMGVVYYVNLTCGTVMLLKVDYGKGPDIVFLQNFFCFNFLRIFAT